MRRNPHQPGSKSARKGPRRVGLTAYQEELLKRELRLTTPSEPWVEAQFQSSIDQDTDGSAIVYRYRDPHVFPPGGEKTLMVRCKHCQIFNPPNAMEEGQCLDHVENEGWGPSPSALAIAALRKYHLEIEETELPPDDAKSLRREIRRYLKKRALFVQGQEKRKSRRRKR